MTGDFKEVSCSSSSPCAYRCMATMGFTCSYSGYCDYQLPRDSRPLTLKPLDTPYGDFKNCTCGSSSSIPCPVHGERAR